MLKKNKDLVWCALGLVLFGLFIFGLNRLNRPEPIQLDLSSNKERSDKHRFVADALTDADLIAENEDQKLDQLNESTPTQTAHPQQPSFSTQNVGSWERQAAPSINDRELSPQLERSLASSAFLSEQDFSSPNSELNYGQTESLREIRRKREEAETQN